jgi:predicted anti-sigma-YlaC factor YlaD
VISCDEFMAVFGDYLEGELAAEVRNQLESHLSHCRTCQVIYDSTRKTLKIVTDSGSLDLPEAAARRVRDKIMARIRKEPAS